MEKLYGLGKLERGRLTEVMRNSKGTISVGEASTILKINRSEVSKMLSRWTVKGWLSRVRQGHYVPVPLESRTADISLEDAWVIAERLYSPCYIGGWSAAEHWDLTEQIFRTILVMTTRKPRTHNPVIKGTSFMLRSIPRKAMFGLKSVWRGQIKIQISDPSRTIIDMLSDPVLGGGIRFTADMFAKYMKSEKKDMESLIKYAKLLGSGAVFKRLGFLLERYGKDEKNAIDTCKLSLTTGNAKLDPKLSADKLITKWRLWVPSNWIKEN